MNKTGVITLLLVAIVGLASCQSHNLVLCNKRDNDVLLYSKLVERAYKLLSRVTSNVSYANPDATITCIEVLDNRTDGTGGTATITEGGLGYRNVTINLRSQLTRGLNFTINIYGH
ncbi:hypothetical protein C0J52_19565 [Blattella germanica]|nr:hypothetical protein C0J52_19565 [Blattella germanica]